jgi:hypothetical protein
MIGIPVRDHIIICRYMALSRPLFFFLLITFSATSVSAQVAERDSLALLAIFDKTDGPNWSETITWTSNPVSAWEGIAVADNRVIALLFTGFGLRGELPPEIWDLV